MKKVLIVLILELLLRPIAWSQLSEPDQVQITELVKQWNSAHGLNMSHQFHPLYGSSVLFYGETRSPDFCTNEKLNLLKRTAFLRQAIISPIKVTLYTSGTVKCDFTKRVFTGNKVQEYPSYLLIARQNGVFRITGEGDLITDRNLKFVLDLGDEVKTTTDDYDSELAGIIIIVVGFLLYCSFHSFWPAKTKLINRKVIHTERDQDFHAIASTSSNSINRQQNQSDVNEKYHKDWPSKNL